MTVKRHRTVELVVSPSVVLEAVERVVESRGYRDVSKLESGDGWLVTVRPHWALLPTRMTVRVGQHATGSRIDVETASQRLIMGDVFGMYDRFISDFLLDLVLRLGGPANSAMKPTAAP